MRVGSALDGPKDEGREKKGEALVSLRSAFERWFMMEGNVRSLGSWDLTAQQQANLNARAPSFVPSARKKKGTEESGDGEYYDHENGDAGRRGAGAPSTIMANDRGDGDDALNLPDDLTDAFTSDLTLGGDEGADGSASGASPAEEDELSRLAERSEGLIVGSLGAASAGSNGEDYGTAGAFGYAVGDGYGDPRQGFYGSPFTDQQSLGGVPGYSHQPLSPQLVPLSVGPMSVPVPVPLPQALHSVGSPPLAVQPQQQQLSPPHVDEETMRMLQEEFPQYSPQSLAEILEANDYDISVTIDVLTQLEVSSRGATAATTMER